MPSPGRHPTCHPACRRPRTGRAARQRGLTLVELVVVLTLAALVLTLIVQQARKLDWPAVGRALWQQPPTGLAIAAALGLLSFALFSSYDLIGRRQTQHRLSVPRTLRIAAAGSARRSRSPSSTLPLTMRPPGGSNRMSESAVMLLPQPDSPTIAKVSPGGTTNEMPSTGFTTP